MWPVTFDGEMPCRTAIWKIGDRVAKQHVGRPNNSDHFVIASYSTREGVNQADITSIKHLFKMSLYVS